MTLMVSYVTRFMWTRAGFCHNGNHFRTLQKLRNFSTHSTQSILQCNEVTIDENFGILKALNIRLPSLVSRIECNQLESNDPIEDRIRVSSILVPGRKRTSLMIGLFDGHGGGTTADLISRRLFNYIALSLQPEPSALRISDEVLRSLVYDLYESPLPDFDAPYYHHNFAQSELNSLSEFSREIDTGADIYTWIRESFKRCDHDLSLEIQRSLQNPHTPTELVHYYQSAAVSGCCACVMIIHDNVGFLASTGDCRAVLAKSKRLEQKRSGQELNEPDNKIQKLEFKTIDLNDEHNCDNISEIKRLTAAHPRTEQNTLIRHNRLLGHLMPSRAFGDFNYKWPIDTIRSCGLVKAFGTNVIPSNYRTPPYLIVEPDIKKFDISHKCQSSSSHNQKNKVEDNENNISNKEQCVNEEERFIVLATDGLWERFESSSEVVKTLLQHQIHESVTRADDELVGPDGIPIIPDGVSILDKNSATHLIRASLIAFPQQDMYVDHDDLARLYQKRLESLLALPPSIVRNFRDDISLAVVKLSNHDPNDDDCQTQSHNDKCQIGDGHH